jgi:hypothetical protein
MFAIFYTVHFYILSIFDLFHILLSLWYMECMCVRTYVCMYECMYVSYLNASYIITMQLEVWFILQAYKRLHDWAWHIGMGKTKTVAQFMHNCIKKILASCNSINKNLLHTHTHTHSCPTIFDSYSKLYHPQTHWTGLQHSNKNNQYSRFFMLVINWNWYNHQ